MKKVLVGTIVAAMVALAGAAMAAGSADLTVQAIVSAGCGINNTTAVSFTIDPASTTDATATGYAHVWCSTGTTGTVAITGDGLHLSGGTKNMASGANLLPYTLSVPDPSVNGQGKSTQIDIAIQGRVAVADFQDAVPANDYPDTVTVTITP